MIQLTISSQGSCWGWEEEFLVTQHTAGCVKSPFLLMLLATSCGTEGHSHKFLHPSVMFSFYIVICRGLILSPNSLPSCPGLSLTLFLSLFLSLSCYFTALL